MTDEFRVPEEHCPNCLSKLDAVTCCNDDKRGPAPGDVTICFYCATVLCFADGLRVEECNQEQFAQLPEELQEEIEKIIRKVKAFHAPVPVFFDEGEDYNW